MIRGFDISNYQGPIDAATMLALKCSEDFAGVIIGTQDAAITQVQYASAFSAELEVEFYVATALEPALALIGSLNAGDVRVWLDYEENTLQAANEADVNADIQAVLDAGFRPGIYTRLDYWNSIGNPQSGARVPLWLADYDNDPTTLKLPTPFGGWLWAQCKQYTNGYNSYGVSMDLDVWSR